MRPVFIEKKCHASRIYTKNMFMRPVFIKKKRIAVNQWKKNAKTPEINPDSPFSILANLKK